MGRHVIGKVSELPPGSNKILALKNRSIGVFNVNGEFYALRNTCPHQGAPLCKGDVRGTTLPSKPGEYIYGQEGEIVRCPWHGWEFNIKDGRSIFDPNKCLVKTYEVEIEQEPSAVETFPVKIEFNNIVVYV
ncbi:MAG: Rieske (2Fe-2S) protein [Paenibacillaceae bacterium]